MTLIKYAFLHPGTPSSYTIPWDSVTHLVLFYWIPDSAGNLSLDDPSKATWYKSLVVEAHNRGKKAIIAIATASDASAIIDQIVVNSYQAFANNALAVIQEFGADGLSMDIENFNDVNAITGVSNTPLYERLMSTLSAKLRPTYKVSQTVGEWTHGYFCNSGLNNYIDELFLMGYDYPYNKGKTYPNAPYNDPTRNDITDTIATYNNNFPKSKMILGVPFYAFQFTGCVSGSAGSAYSGMTPIFGETLVNQKTGKTRLWDSNSSTPWFAYQENGTWTQVWYDDVESLNIKYQYAKDQAFLGVGYWALGQETGYEDVVQLFADSGNDNTKSISSTVTGSGSSTSTINLKTSQTKLSSTVTGTGTTTSKVKLKRLWLSATATGSGTSTVAAQKSASWQEGYAYRKTIIVDHTKVSTGLANFPVLVSLANDSDIGAHALASGFDIRITTEDGALLNYEREKFTISGGICTASIWVNVPAISSTVDTLLYLYYGKSDATDGQNKTGTWNSNYKRVWHLTETGTGAASNYKDSTSTAAHSFNTANQPTVATGKIASGQTFNGTSQYIQVAASSPGDLIQTNFTFDWWSKGTGNIIGSAQGNKIVVSTTNFGVVGQFPPNTGSYYSYLFTPATLDTTAWHHFTLTFTGTILKGYLDGVEVTPAITAQSSTCLNLLFLGKNDYWPNYLTGSLDEVRVSDIARPAAWVNAQYANQNSPSTFYSLGIQETASTATTKSISSTVVGLGLATSTITKQTIKRISSTISSSSTISVISRITKNIISTVTGAGSSSLSIYKVDGSTCLSTVTGLGISTATSRITKKINSTVTGSGSESSNIYRNNSSTIQKYGFLPYSDETYVPPWDALTHVSLYTWTVGSTGALTDPAGMTYFSSIVSAAHTNGKKATINIVCSSASALDSILANSYSTFVTNVRSKIVALGADGVCLDFRNFNDINSVSGGSNINLFERMMSALSAAIRPTYHVTFCISEWVRDAFKNPNLNSYADAFFLMGYDYPYNKGVTYPNSPLNDSVRNDISDTLAAYSLYLQSSKIILGLPLYGFKFTGCSSGAEGAAYTGSSYLDIDECIAAATAHGRIFDADSQTPWTVYQETGSWTQIWYDDADSLRIKYNYAKAQALLGIGYYKLTQEIGYPEVVDVFIENVKYISSSVTGLGISTATSKITKIQRSTVTGSGFELSRVNIKKNLSSTVTGSSSTPTFVRITKNISSTVTATGTTTVNVNLVTSGTYSSYVIGSGISAVTSRITKKINSLVTASGSTSTIIRVKYIVKSTVTGSSSSSSTIQVTKKVSSIVTCTSSTTSSVDIQKNISSTVTGLGSSNSTYGASKFLNSTVTSAGSTSVKVQITKRVSSSVSGSSSELSRVKIRKNISSSITASGITSSNIHVDKNISSTVSAEGTTYVNVNLVTSGTYSSYVIGSGISAVTIRITKNVSSSLTGLGDSTVISRWSNGYSSTVTGSGSYEVIVQIKKKISSSVTGTSSNISTVQVTKNISSTVLSLGFSALVSRLFKNIHVLATASGSTTSSVKITKNISSTVTGAGSTTARTDLPTTFIKYGFLPFQIAPETYIPPWDSLTHIALFNWEVSSTGEITGGPTDLTYFNSIISTAHNIGKKVTLTITCSDAATFDNVLANSYGIFAINLRNKIIALGVDGVCIDIENFNDDNSISEESNTPLYERMMRVIYEMLHPNRHHISVCVSGNWIRWAFRNAALNNYTDNILLMGYDYSIGAGHTYANAPLRDPNEFDISDSIYVLQEFYKNSKMVLLVPFYGFVFNADSGEKGAHISASGTMRVPQCETAAITYGKNWDTASQTPWTAYQDDNGNWVQIWYDDSYSLELKYKYSLAEALAGVGYWALSQEIGYEAAATVFKPIYQPIGIGSYVYGGVGATSSTAKVTKNISSSVSGIGTYSVFGAACSIIPTTDTDIHRTVTITKTVRTVVI